jgi:hypothetical protein
MTDKQLATIEGAGDVLEQVVIQGDLANLEPAARVSYYKQVCESVGLNPLTKPFDYIKLNGKLTLYALRTCADQLRQLHGVSIKVLSKETIDGLFTVHVGAKDKTGRQDEDIGSVMIAGLRGEAKANAMAKAMTKAKRRVTLSICGLGWLDENEVAGLKGAEAPSQSLDELFPTMPTEEPQVEPVVEVLEPQEEAPAATDRAPGAYHLAIPPFGELEGGLEHYDLDSDKEFYEEYLKQLKYQAAIEEIPSREKMTRLKAFEQANLAALDAIPLAGKKKLLEWRKKLNRKLGALAKKEAA